MVGNVTQRCALVKLQRLKARLRHVVARRVLEIAPDREAERGADADPHECAQHVRARRRQCARKQHAVRHKRDRGGAQELQRARAIVRVPLGLVVRFDPGVVERAVHAGVVEVRGNDLRVLRVLEAALQKLAAARVRGRMRHERERGSVKTLSRAEAEREITEGKNENCGAKRVE